MTTRKKAETIENTWHVEYDKAETGLGIVLAFLEGIELSNRWPHKSGLENSIFRMKKAVENAQNALRHAYNDTF